MTVSRDTEGRELVRRSLRTVRMRLEAKKVFKRDCRDGACDQWETLLGHWAGHGQVSELIYQQLLAKKACPGPASASSLGFLLSRFLQEHSGIDAWYQEYVSEAGPEGRG